jgi:hypothetical protein
MGQLTLWLEPGALVFLMVGRVTVTDRRQGVLLALEVLGDRVV